MSSALRVSLSIIVIFSSLTSLEMENMKVSFHVGDDPSTASQDFGCIKQFSFIISLKNAWMNNKYTQVKNENENAPDATLLVFSWSSHLIMA